MKKIVCDICEGTEFVKDDGSFICRNCGTKYTLEAIKTMIVDDNSSSNTNTNLYINAIRAFEDKRYKEAEELFSEILSSDVDNYEAMSYQALSMLSINKTNREKIQQARRIMARALNTANKNITQNKDIEDYYTKFLSDFYSIVFKNESFCLEVFRRMANDHGEAGLRARNIFNMNDADVFSVPYVHPAVDFSDVDMTVSEYYSGPEKAVFFLNLVLEHSELQINIYDIIVNALSDVNSFSSETYKLLENIMTIARNIVFIVDRYSAEAKKIMNIFQKQNEICTRKRKITSEAYWASHPEEKDAIEKEILSLKENIEALNKRVKSTINDQDYNKRQATIAGICEQLEYLGYDRKEERAELEERIANLQYVNMMKLKEIEVHNFNISGEIEKMKWRLSELLSKIENPY